MTIHQDTADTMRDIYAHPAAQRVADMVFDERNNWGVSGDIDWSCAFMGHGIYEALAAIIPPGRVIYDFGAAYGFQSWLFRHHRRYIAIQPECSPTECRFRTDNSIWFTGTIADFFDLFSVETGSFAICNAIPSSEVQLVKMHCPHVYVNYPEHCDLPPTCKSTS